MSSTNSNSSFIIAIDGPVASGKGTIATLLAKKIKGIKIDTGSMYRAVAYKCIQLGINCSDEANVVALLDSTEIELKKDDNGELSLILLDGKVVNSVIRTSEIAQGASMVGQHKKVRSFLVNRQKKIIKDLVDEGNSVVIEGRIVATEVVPDAKFKLFLTATSEIRAKRRSEQYRKNNINLSLNEVIKDTLQRDLRDAKHLPINPEKHGYFVLDNSNLDQEQTLSAIIAALRHNKLIK